MTLDRYGEPKTEDCPYHCRKGGWLTPEDADLQRPCPIHRPRREPTGTDYNPANISERAAAVIERAGQNDHT